MQKRILFYLEQVVVDQEPVPGGGGVDCDGGDLPVLELKAQVAGRVLVQGQRALKRPGNIVFKFKFLPIFL